MIAKRAEAALFHPNHPQQTEVIMYILKLEQSPALVGMLALPVPINN